MAADMAHIPISVKEGYAPTFSADVLALKYAQTHFGVEEEVFNCLSKGGVIDLPKIDEAKMVQADGRIVAPQVLYFGVKPPSKFRCQDNQGATYRILSSLAKQAPQTSDLCLVFENLWLMTLNRSAMILPVSRKLCRTARFLTDFGRLPFLLTTQYGQSA